MAYCCLSRAKSAAARDHHTTSVVFFYRRRMLLGYTFRITFADNSVFLNVRTLPNLPILQFARFFSTIRKIAISDIKTFAEVQANDSSASDLKKVLCGRESTLDK